MFVRGLLALEERRRVGADRVVRPYEWQRFALRDVGDAVPYEQAVVCLLYTSDAADEL